MMKKTFHLLAFQLLVKSIMCRVFPDMRARLGPAVSGRVVLQQDGATCHTANIVSIHLMVTVVDEPGLN